MKKSPHLYTVSCVPRFVASEAFLLFADHQFLHFLKCSVHMMGERNQKALFTNFTLSSLHHVDFFFSSVLLIRVARRHRWKRTEITGCQRRRSVFVRLMLQVMVLVDGRKAAFSVFPHFYHAITTLSLALSPFEHWKRKTVPWWT